LNVSVKLVGLVGAAAEVNYFNPTLVGLAQQNIFRLHVAVHDLVLLDVVQRHEDLNCKPAYQAFGNSLEVIHFYEFVQVHRHHLEGQN